MMWILFSCLCIRRVFLGTTYQCNYYGKEDCSDTVMLMDTIAYDGKDQPTVDCATEKKGKKCWHFTHSGYSGLTYNNVGLAGSYIAQWWTNAYSFRIKTDECFKGAFWDSYHKNDCNYGGCTFHKYSDKCCKNEVGSGYRWEYVYSPYGRGVESVEIGGDPNLKLDCKADSSKATVPQQVASAIVGVIFLLCCICCCVVIVLVVLVAIIVPIIAVALIMSQKNTHVVATLDPDSSSVNSSYIAQQVVQPQAATQVHVTNLKKPLHEPLL